MASHIVLTQSAALILTKTSIAAGRVFSQEPDGASWQYYITAACTPACPAPQVNLEIGFIAVGYTSTSAS